MITFLNLSPRGSKLGWSARDIATFLTPDHALINHNRRSVLSAIEYSKHIPLSSLNTTSTCLKPVKPALHSFHSSLVSSSFARSKKYLESRCTITLMFRISDLCRSEIFLDRGLEPVSSEKRTGSWNLVSPVHNTSVPSS